MTTSPPMARLHLLALSAAVGALSGATCALFLAALGRVTAWQAQSAWLWMCLPAWGLLLGVAAETVGRPADPGMRLVLEDLAGYEGRVPRRIVPYVLLGTLGTHLFGGSAGREGTAVQVGAGISRALASAAQLPPGAARTLLVAGVAGGFAALFGTPFGGALFAVEVGAHWRLRGWALAPALVAAFVGDLTSGALGATHGHWQVNALAPSLPAVGAVALAGAAFTLAGAGYVAVSHGISRVSRAVFPRAPARLALGGAVVVLAVALWDGRRFLGLGLPQLEASLAGVTPGPAEFALKLAFTALTVGVGFKGGEVTPLFSAGALLGAALGPHLGVEPATLAAVGLVTLFGAAAHTPLAAMVMGLELFGPGLGWPLALACAVTVPLRGPWGLYPAAPGSLARGSAGPAV